MDVKIRSKRILKYMDNYLELPKGTEHECVKKISLQPGEAIIGLYTNNKEFSDNWIIITDLGLHVLYQEYYFIDYLKIKKVEMPEGKTSLRGFNILMRGRVKMWVPVEGEQEGRFYDAFEFIRFIDRVLEDLK